VNGVGLAHGPQQTPNVDRQCHELDGLEKNAAPASLQLRGDRDILPRERDGVLRRFLPLKWGRDYDLAKQVSPNINLPSIRPISK
jgi:hypothetical protein